MRNIKFRGQTGTTEGKKWVYGNYYKVKSFFNDKEAHFIGVIRSNHLTDYSIDEDTLGQYTGLKDKNGKEIYEGDILKDKWNTIYVVKYRNTGFYIYRNNGRNGYSKISSWNGDKEVIGNIWEDSDLLDDRENKKNN